MEVRKTNVPNMKMLLSLAALTVPAGMVWAQTPNPSAGVVPGTVNYVEGQVQVDGKPVTKSSVGKTAVPQGATISTGDGKAEVLLTPGVFVRLGANSEMTMVKPDLTRTEVELERGKADVEVDQVYKQNDLLVDQDGQKVKLLDNGLYAFDTNQGTLQVFNGKANVTPDDGDGEVVKGQTVKGGHELALNDPEVKPAKFKKKDAEDGLYDFSNLRSNYLGEANTQLANQYPGGFGFSPGWAWNSGLLGYTWLPGDGAFLSPFGYGFYSPLAFYGYGGYPGIYGNGYSGGTYNRTGIGRRGIYSGPVGRIGSGSGTAAGSGIAASGLHGGAIAGGARGGAISGGVHGGAVGSVGGAGHSGGGGGHR